LELCGAHRFAQRSVVSNFRHAQEDDFQLARALQEQERALYLLQGDAGYE
jgi:hypothetical protein